MSTTVRLSPLIEEHSLPFLVDMLFFFVLDGVLTFGFGVTARGTGAVAGIALVVAFHFVQVRTLVTLRFDDEGVTVVRPWRRRRVAWKDVAGLVYAPGPAGGSARSPYRLRLVLRGQEPPLGRYMSDSQLATYAGGPVLMARSRLDPDDPDSKAGQCRARVFEELERHGFPQPELRSLEFRFPGFSPLALRSAVAADLVGAHGVVIEHGAEPDAAGAELLERALPELARAHGAAEKELREPTFVSFFFERPLTEQDAAAFLAEAAQAVPAGWKVTAGVLPGVGENRR